MMKTDEIRDSFLDFFKKKNHPVIPSDSLVPANDPSLLFTGAGMNQFKEYFLGVKKDLKRAASSQKCLRTGDLEEVGRTPYHHSFFEMLGNFSFGDYFKKEAIEWAWEYLTANLKIPKERLRVSVHRDDQEAYDIWTKIIRKDWIYKLGDKDNFWPSNAPKDGPNGPCGPCSEIYFDQDPSQGDGGTVEDKRFAEIWNLVFTQYDRQDGGKLVPLAQKNIDTGMGLERLACVLQDAKTNYEIDTFKKINEAIEKHLNVKVPKENRNNLYVISDHLRAIVFAIADGAIPSNEGRGYVIRKLIRRAIWSGFDIAPSKKGAEIFLSKIVPTIVEVMSKAYPELKDAEKSIMKTLELEETQFSVTVSTGREFLMGELDELKKHGLKVLSGEAAFELHDTYGFRLESTEYIAAKQGITVDRVGFDKLMGEQRKRAKDATQIASAIFSSTDLEKKIAQLPETQFTGYDQNVTEAKVLFAEFKGKEGIVVLDQTPCYAESGGQVGDYGIMEGGSFKARITDTLKKDKVFLHSVEIEKGSLKAGDKVKVAIDLTRRQRAMRNHTATHLLHAALRKVLGEQVRQLGSLVAPEKLRFDYSYGQALAPAQLQEIEDLVNEEILKNTPLTKEEKPTEEAKKDGAIAFFGEKYGSRVRVISIPGFSKEFCGGTHCSATGQIGAFLIVAETSVASGTRRIEALTGEGVLEYTRTMRSQVMRLADELKTTPAQLEERVQKLKSAVKNLEKSKGQTAGAVDPKQILQEAHTAGTFRFAAFHQKALPIPEMLGLSDSLRTLSQDTVYLLGTESEDKINFLLGMSGNLVQKQNLDLRDLMKELSPLLGASGGGRRDLIQGGGKNENQLQQNWPKIISRATTYLEKK